MKEIIYEEKPMLEHPVLIMGFEGWPNAGEVSSFALQQLVEATDAKKFASLDNEPFYQISSHRPTAVIREGRLIELKPGGSDFYYAKGVPPNDLILFSGIEPHMRWESFTERLMGLAERYEVSQLISIGGTYDYVPHTHPPKVSALFNQDGLKEKVVKAGLDLTMYTGPISIHTLILDAATKKGFKAVSLWGHAPHYLQTRNVKVACEVLKKLRDFLEADIDLSELEQASDYFDQQVHQLVQQDPKLQDIIRKLEEAYRESEEALHLAETTEEAKEEKVVYLRAFLKRQSDEEKQEG